MQEFTDLKNLKEITDFLPRKIKKIDGINIKPLELKIYGKTEDGLDFTFELHNKKPPKPSISFDCKKPPF